MMKTCFLFLLCLGSIMIFESYRNAAFAHCPQPSNPSDPHYQPHCGIWLCLPGGFPSDCSQQKNAFQHRLSHVHKGCSPLPDYSRCTGGAGNGTAVAGKAYKPCDSGYIQKFTENSNGTITSSRCMSTSRGCKKSPKGCMYSNAKRWYVDMTIDGQKYPRYWN